MIANRLDVLAHELRSPVAALSAIAESYPAADEPTRRRLLVLARTAGLSLGRLLADADNSSLDVTQIDVRELARGVAETATVRGASVVFEAEVGLIVLGDADRLRQALDNLIANAIGHSPVGSRVRVRAYAAGGSVALAVSDGGEGIEPGDLERIFDPGVRLTGARPGSGLGLAVVREVAVEHGGEVEVESSPGRGSTFRLLLPGASAAP